MCKNSLDFKRAWIRFCEFGGLKLLWEYYRIGLTKPIIAAAFRCIKERRSLKTVYYVVQEKAEQTLIDRYGHLLKDSADRQHRNDEAVGNVPPIIWTAWLQGLELAPRLVRSCIASQRKCFPCYEHRILTLDNYRQWVELPEWVEEKYARGMIPAALFSDVLRVAVLKRYGGVWMDASVLCTGFGNQQLQKQWTEVENSRFAVFRYYRKGDRYPSGLSNWFIAATPDNVVLTSVYDMLTAYWRDYDCTIDYYMMHLFISCALKAFPEMEREMPKLNSRYSFFLGDALSRTYSQEAWQELVDHVAIHKLNYRKAEEAQKNPQSYYNFILEINQNDIQT